ncbi:Imm26 family immunity protein [Pedobacter rhizosphaerae]|uniref:Immunity protein 26 n=1 Tax=Pedobacter rhizosphaerae TaxID=390241 RepID=A0A1H9UH97_9SPHI|nr:Imm26 family immunity protein [Pedobacter rhizosphaerae]SES08806.1 hypothetical protein SAMN04488023_1316 [Pedobacter rhizosphaerae]
MKKNKAKVGDIFYLKLKDLNKYVFGRILFDVDNQYHKVVDTNTFPDDYFPYLLMSHDGCQLVEMYNGVYDKVEHFKHAEILIPRIFTRSINSKSNSLEWGIVDNKPVDYTQVEFPEQLNLSNNYIHLDRGELSVKTSIKKEEAEKLGFKTGLYTPFTILNATLDFQGKRDLIPEDSRWPVYVKNIDLLYDQQLRNKIYSDLNIDPKKSYYELAKEMGFDLARFY